MTVYQAFRERWQGGCGSGLCEGAAKVVLCRGALPCDVLYIGEAPGVSEDALGLPFVGPAGKLLDWIIERARPEEDGRPLRWAFTNLVCCLPRDPDGRKAAEPLPEEIEDCRPRLEQFVSQIARPRLIVCVGDLSKGWVMGTKGRRHLLTDYGGKLVHIIHPAAILRANVAQQGLMRQRAVVVLHNALEELCHSQTT